MKKSLILSLAAVFFFFGCAVTEDKLDAKSAALKAVQEYCDANSKEGIKYEAGGIASAVTQSNESFIKVFVTVTKNGKKTKKQASVGLERDSEKNWTVKDFTVQ